MKSIKYIALAALMAPALLNAAVVTPGAGSYTFVGTNIELTRTFLGFPVTLICNVVLEGEVDVVSGGVTIEVTDGEIVGGQSLCSQVSFSFPWYASEVTSTPPSYPGLVPDSILPLSSNPGAPVPGQFNDVDVNTSIGPCSGSIAVTYANGDHATGVPSTFSFTNAQMGACRLTGVFESDPDIVTVCSDAAC